MNRADFRFVPSQWETTLFCNDVSYWLGASLKSALMKPATSQGMFLVISWNTTPKAADVMMPTLSSMVAPDVVVMTTSIGGVTRNLPSRKISVFSSWWRQKVGMMTPWFSVDSHHTDYLLDRLGVVELKTMAYKTAKNSGTIRLSVRRHFYFTNAIVSPWMIKPSLRLCFSVTIFTNESRGHIRYTTVVEIFHWIENVMTLAKV